MKFLTTRVRLDDNRWRVRNVLMGEPTSNVGHQSVKSQSDLLRTLVDTPSLGMCGNTWYEKLRQYHDGNAWLLEMESINESEENINGKTNSVSKSSFNT